MKVTLDPALTPPEDWRLAADNASYMPYDEGIGGLLVTLMGAGLDPDRFELRCGRQMLCQIARSLRVAVVLDGWSKKRSPSD